MSENTKDVSEVPEAVSVSDEEYSGWFVFEAPVTVTLEYSDADLGGANEDTLALLTWDTSTQAWVDAACGAYGRYPAENRLVVPICHLSRFGLFSESYAVFLPLVVR